jgi:hypothetical protein
MGVSIQQLREPRLEYRTFSRLQILDSPLVDVDAYDIVSHVGEYGRGDQPDITTSQNTYFHSFRRLFRNEMFKSI